MESYASARHGGSRVPYSFFFLFHPLDQHHRLQRPRRHFRSDANPARTLNKHRGVFRGNFCAKLIITNAYFDERFRIDSRLRGAAIFNEPPENAPLLTRDSANENELRVRVAAGLSGRRTTLKCARE